LRSSSRAPKPSKLVRRSSPSRRPPR
jgi:hypothetical protein